MKLLEKLQLIQSKLKAPKNQRNNFGNYNYRSCEDILEAVKPLLEEQRLTLTISDDIVNIGDRYYVKAIVKIQDETETKEVSAFARESETKKGMDESQITGACSSYARKYALNGLFLIDDTKDADSMDNTKDTKDDVWTMTLKSCKTLSDLQQCWLTIPVNNQTKELVALKDSLKTNLK